MNRNAAVLIACTIFTIVSSSSGGVFTPHMSLTIEGGATRSFLQTDSQMTLFFAPTSGVNKPIRPAFGLELNLTLGNYLGIASGVGYRSFGQSTQPTTVLLRNDIFEHDFKSEFSFDYFTVPLIIKGGIHKSFFSIFLRFGIQPSLLIDKKAIWIIDGNTLSQGNNRIPNVEISWWDIPLHFGGEAGVHIGKNGFFIVGQYLYGFHDIASGISGRVFNRSYGATLQYRRDLF